MQEGQERRCWEAESQSCLNQGLITVLTGQPGWRAQREMHVLMGGQNRLHATKPPMGTGDQWDTRLPYRWLCNEHLLSTFIMAVVATLGMTITIPKIIACVSEIKSHCIAPASIALGSSFHGAGITVVCCHA